jgi:hypothetical protein
MMNQRSNRWLRSQNHWIAGLDTETEDMAALADRKGPEPTARSGDP